MDTIEINVADLAKWLEARDTDNMMGNEILDGLEELYSLETKLAKYFN